jgi:cation diffusion facilitator CzcD-associated flavoprotein CzcO
MAPTHTGQPEIDLEPVLDPLRDVDVRTYGPSGELRAGGDDAPVHPTRRAGGDGGPLPREVRVAIIGAGFGGIDAAIQLHAAGERDLIVLERADGPSGCWRANHYPGVACDVPSNLYSFSFAPNPNWSRTYSPGGEIADYVESVAREYGALDHVRFGVTVTHARWIETDEQWELETDHGTLRSQFVVGATGPLTEPVYPDIEGRESFDGIQMHSARWEDDVDLRGKRVAVIGTGASAIQLVPEVAKIASQVDVYQRTAPWVLPRTDRPTTALERWLFRAMPFTQRLSRAWTYATRELIVAGMRGNRLVRGTLEALGRAQLRRQVPDAALREQLTPEFDIGCKRILLSNAWYPTLAKPDTHVVSEPIAAITPTGVVTADGTARDVDAIVYSTGFHVTDSPLADAIVGEGGQTLAQHWGGSPKCYLGTTIDGFPNLFMLVGANSGVGHTSILLTIEWQVGYLTQAIAAASREGISSYALRPPIMQAWVDEIDRRSEGTVWLAGGCKSYYVDATGRNATTWPTYTWKLRDRLAQFDPAAYVVRRADVSSRVAG